MNTNFSDELISAYLDGELTTDEQAAVERALAENPAARQMFEELRALRAGLQALPQSRLDDDFAQRVLRSSEREMLKASGPFAKPAGSGGGMDAARLLRNWQRRFWIMSTVAAALLIVLSVNFATSGIRGLASAPRGASTSESELRRYVAPNSESRSSDAIRREIDRHDGMARAEGSDRVAGVSGEPAPDLLSAAADRVPLAVSEPSADEALLDAVQSGNESTARARKLNTREIAGVAATAAAKNAPAPAQVESPVVIRPLAESRDGRVDPPALTPAIAGKLPSTALHDTVPAEPHPAPLADLAILQLDLGGDKTARDRFHASLARHNIDIAGLQTPAGDKAPDTESNSANRFAKGFEKQNASSALTKLDSAAVVRDLEVLWIEASPEQVVDALRDFADSSQRVSAQFWSDQSAGNPLPQPTNSAQLLSLFAIPTDLGALGSGARGGAGGGSAGKPVGRAELSATAERAPSAPASLNAEKANDFKSFLPPGDPTESRELRSGYARSIPSRSVNLGRPLLRQAESDYENGAKKLDFSKTESERLQKSRVQRRVGDNERSIEELAEYKSSYRSKELADRTLANTVRVLVILRTAPNRPDPASERPESTPAEPEKP